MFITEKHELVQINNELTKYFFEKKENKVVLYSSV